ncbi:MAG: hypothetical protein KTR14_08035 [Vampirovibrio sp.]|nr:hypothetical protein [Vampirovibrio sp.]
MQHDKLAKLLGQQYAKALKESNMGPAYSGDEDSIYATLQTLALLNQGQIQQAQVLSA